MELQKMVSGEAEIKAAQISGLFQKFATVCKTKTLEFFAEEDEEITPLSDDVDLDLPEELITDQKVVVIKPDRPLSPPHEFQSQSPPDMGKPKPLLPFLSCIFASLSAFESAYLQLQTAHDPFDVENVKAADRAVIAQLKRLSEIKHLYKNSGELPPFDSILESQVQERQSMLRTYDMTVNRLQAQIDVKDEEACFIKQKFEKLDRKNLRLESRLSNSDGKDVSLSFGVFDSALQGATKTAHSFTKVFIDMMKESGWDLDSAAESVHSGIDYAKKGHNRYAFLSYVCLVMFSDFDREDFSIGKEILVLSKKDRLRKFMEGKKVSAFEFLMNNPEGWFAKFAKKKYLQLLHPKMEMSFFGNLEQRNIISNHNCRRWPLTNPLLESFLKMAYSIWLLHWLAFAFEPAITIFQVKKGAEFSMVYMENIASRTVFVGSDEVQRPTVSFTVVPGFRISKTVIQCQVYLNGMSYLE